MEIKCEDESELLRDYFSFGFQCNETRAVLSRRHGMKRSSFTLLLLSVVSLLKGGRVDALAYLLKYQLMSGNLSYTRQGSSHL